MAAEAAARPLGAVEADRLLELLLNARGVALAVSGGADSMALMHLAAEWRARHAPGLAMRVLTVDHGLRAEAAREAGGVGRAAARLGLDHAMLRWRGPYPASGLAAAARDARYRLLADACAAHGLDRLVTAHHLDDQAETVLMRLAHGSGLDGLGAMRAVAARGDVVLVRPFLGVPGARLVATLRARGAAWFEDPTNADARFARPRLRAAMPLLAAEGLTAERLSVTARRLTRAADALEHYAAAAWRDVVRADPAGFCRLDAARLAALPEEIALRVVGSVLRRVGGGDRPPRLERLERLCASLVAGGDFPGATLAGCRMLADGAGVTVCRERRRAGLPPAEARAGSSLVWDNRFRVDVAELAACDLTVGPLGVDGLRQMRALSRVRPMPAAAAHTSAAAFHRDRLFAAPHLEAEPGRFSPPGVAIAFLGDAGATRA